MTLGNHDDLMRKWVEHDRDIPTSWFSDPFWEGTAWCAKQLERTGWIEALRDLPMSYRLPLQGAPRILVSHGSPRHYREGYGSHLTDEAISEITQTHPADVLVGSHTHRPLRRTWGHHLVLNTGSVGSPFNGDPRAQYLLLTLQGNDWKPEFRRIPYDRESALAAFRDSNFLGEGGLSAHIFFEELRYASPFLMPFLMWTEERAWGQTWEAWRVFREVFEERFREPDDVLL